MSSRFSDESAVAAEYQEKLEQLQNELALAQYEAQKWKEKYLVEKRRRQKTARDLLDLVVRTERLPSGFDNDAGAIAGAGDASSLHSPDHTANLLSPTLSSFDFDDDSSEESDDSSGHGDLGTLHPLVDATRNEPDILEATEGGDSRSMRSAKDPFSLSLALDLRDRQSLMHHLNATATIPGRVNRSSTTGSAMEAIGGSSRRLADGKSGNDNDVSQQQQQHLMYRIIDQVIHQMGLSPIFAFQGVFRWLCANLNKWHPFKAQ
ncbi:hypothetical protein PHYBOEH_007128 [Phytophthora boehmeriae]|uniref:Uncharacterized protein n=1 Tax=Phytophthora boehmeriae TaxID=109152 RepID=A0A8T1X9F1_9STRA|nr:hypothetical protein PHYBOEH_007128 [Phytophthora boehmeriae]